MNRSEKLTFDFIQQYKESAGHTKIVRDLSMEGMEVIKSEVVPKIFEFADSRQKLIMEQTGATELEARIDVVTAVNAVISRVFRETLESRFNMDRHVVAVVATTVLDHFKDIAERAAVMATLKAVQSGELSTDHEDARMALKAGLETIKSDMERRAKFDAERGE